MKFKKTTASALVMSLLCACLSGCGGTEKNTDTGGTTALEADTALDKIDMSAWKYQSGDDVYWQTGISYCSNPADEKYETMGIFVPGAYMTAKDNQDGTFTCEINPNGKAGPYTAATAPMVIPIETPGYSAMAAPTDYDSSIKQYTDAGFVYLYAGARGRDAGAPAGVTDFKAAIRYTRYNAGIIPGDTDSIFSFGMSGGGAQSALLGATGDSGLYTPYLEAIGAVSDVGDSVAGSMCWCPITNLDIANEAYEWNMGSTRTKLDDFTQELSDNMAKEFADYINDIKLTDKEGNVLTLEESDTGIYQAGTYYDYIKNTVEESLNQFLAVTEFPYTPSSSNSGFGAGGRGNGGMGRGGMDGGKKDFDDLDEDAKAEMEKNFGGEKPDGVKEMPRGDAGPGENLPDQQNAQYAEDGIQRDDNAASQTDTNTYETAEDYIDSLNKDGQWIDYDSAKNTASITSVADFVKHCKNASKSVGAFDDLNAAQGENTLFGYGDGAGAHFDPIMSKLLKGSEYETAYAEDLQKTDAQKNTVDYRMNMYNPMYYLSGYYDGYGSSNVAKYWRIRTGINQGDTALATEVNLALALENNENTENVDFATIWGAGHVKAESEGDSDSNFISWVNSCMDSNE